MADPVFKMQASGATQDVQHTWEDRQPRVPFADEPSPHVAKRRTTAPDTDPFRFGFRHRLKTTADGQESVEQVPLDAEDLLYPQEGDVVADGYPHNEFLHPEADSLRRHLKKRRDFVVTCDVMLVLRSDGKNCAPDVAVIEGDVDRSTIERGVHLRKAGGRLVFALEVVSTSEKAIEEKDTRGNVGRYAQEGVAEYFTVYPIRERRVKDLVGRTLVEGDYVEIAPDAAGRVYSAQLDLFFQIDAVSEELRAFDAQTGQLLLISDEEEAGRKIAEVGRKIAEAALGEAEVGRKIAEAARGESEAARGEAEAALGEAEAALGESEAAREQEAEARRQEAKARRQAEEDKKKAEEDKKKAEEDKKKAEKDKKKAEQRNREMTAEIERLRAQLENREEGEA